MQGIVYSIIISLLFSCNISFSMQESLSTRKMCAVVCAAIGCGISLYLASKYASKYGGFIVEWWNFFVDRTTKNKENKNKQVIKKVSAAPEGKNMQINAVSTDTNISKNVVFTPGELKKLVEEEQRKKWQQSEQAKRGTVLHIACDENDEQQVKLLLEQNININVMRSTIEDWHGTKVLQEGGTALHIACKNKNKNIIDLLLLHPDIDVSLENDKKSTPLYFAVLHNDEDLIEQLLAHKTMKFTNNKALSAACKKGYIDIVVKLLECNTDNCMDINQRIGWLFNPLEITCIQVKKCEEKIQLLYEIENILPTIGNVEIPCDIERKVRRLFENRERSKEILAIKDQQVIKNKIDEMREKCDRLIKIVKLLLNNPFIEMDASVFQWAVSNVELLRLLYEKKTSIKTTIDINTLNEALYSAAALGNQESFFLLLQYGACISQDSKENPLRLLCERAAKSTQKKLAQTRYKNIMIRLLEQKEAYGITVDTINASHCLLVSFDDESVGNDDLPLLLLENGANPNKIGEWPWTDWSPVLKAAGWKNLPLLNLFIDKYNGDINQQRNGETVFYIAFMHKTIQKPGEINYFSKLDEYKKKAFIEKELTILVNNVPHCSFLNTYSSGGDIFNKIIKRLNAFVEICIEYVDNDDEFNVKTLLAIARKKAEERHNNFSTKTRKPCMYSENDKCPTMYSSGCRCEHYFKYNELMVHALIRHTDIQDVDRIIVDTYKKKPMKYYSLHEYDKNAQKNALQKALSGSH